MMKKAKFWAGYIAGVILMAIPSLLQFLFLLVCAMLPAPTNSSGFRPDIKELFDRASKRAFGAEHFQ